MKELLSYNLKKGDTPSPFFIAKKGGKMRTKIDGTKYIFVTGGVVSSLGKGIVASSLGRLLKERGYKVTIQKFDPYINVDPGTMSPYQHEKYL